MLCATKTQGRSPSQNKLPLFLFSVTTIPVVASQPSSVSGGTPPFPGKGHGAKKLSQRRQLSSTHSSRQKHFISFSIFILLDFHHHFW